MDARGTAGIPGIASALPFTGGSFGPRRPAVPSPFDRDFWRTVLDVLSLKADRVSAYTAGNLASVGPAGNLADSGLKPSDLQAALAFDTAPALGSANPVTSDGIRKAIDAAAPAGYAELTERVAGIQGKIPDAATAQNKLADRAFVNSSVATNTANYISDSGQPFQSLADLENYRGAPTNNDYAFVVGTDSDGNTTYTRYKWSGASGAWGKEYVLNNSSFTAAQWAAIASGITSGLVAKLGALPTAEALAEALAGKQDKLTFESSVVKESGNPVKSSGIWSMIWGALTALPAGFSSFYDWCAAQFAKYLPLAGGTMTGGLELLSVQSIPPQPGAGLLLRYVSDAVEAGMSFSPFGVIRTYENTDTSRENYLATLPKASGTIALTSDIPSVPVQSVNGQTGAVALTGEDVAVGASDATTIAAALAAQNAKRWLTRWDEADRSAGRDFAKGALVVHGGAIYECVDYYTADEASPAPDLDATHWLARPSYREGVEPWLDISDGDILQFRYGGDYSYVGMSINVIGDFVLTVGSDATGAADSTILNGITYIDGALVNESTTRIWDENRTSYYALDSGVGLRAFSALDAYASGEFVVYQNAIYRLRSPHRGAWAASNAEWIADLGGIASRASSPTAGHLAALDADGNPTDSGKSAADFLAAAPLSGNTFDFSTTQGVMDALAAVVAALGGSVTNKPTATTQGE